MTAPIPHPKRPVPPAGHAAPPASQGGAGTPLPSVAPVADGRGIQDPGSGRVCARAAGPVPSPGGGRAPREGAPLTGNQAIIARGMSEATLEEHVRCACQALNIVRIHVYNSRGTTPGVPDDILIGPRGLLWRELKAQRGRVSPAQQAMGEALTAAGQDFAIWRPADLMSGRIARELLAISGRAGRVA